MSETINDALLSPSSGKDFNSNVPDPPQLRLYSVPTQPGLPAMPDISQDHLTIPGDAGVDSTAEPIHQLRNVLDELATSFATIKAQQSAPEASSRKENTSSTSIHREVTPPGSQGRVFRFPEVTANDNQGRFLAAATHFLSLAGFPVIQDLVAQALRLQDSSLNPESPGKSSASDIEPLLEEYYEAAGNVKMLGERLVNMDYTYAEDATTRLFLQDQGMELETTDQTFNEEYSIARAKLEHELDRAIDLADELKAQCRSAGLDPEAHVRNAYDSDVEGSLVVVDVDKEGTGFPTTQSLYKPIIATPVEASTGRLDGDSTPSLRAPLDPGQLDLSVSRWMETVETPDEDTVSEAFNDTDTEKYLSSDQRAQGTQIVSHDNTHYRQSWLSHKRPASEDCPPTQTESSVARNANRMALSDPNLSCLRWEESLDRSVATGLMQNSATRRAHALRAPAPSSSRYPDWLQALSSVADALAFWRTKAKRPP